MARSRKAKPSSVISEQLEQRTALDLALERSADEALSENRTLYVSTNSGAQEALRMILGWMKLSTDIVLGCKSVQELLECTLSPQGIMYTETDLSDDEWRKRSEFILAQLEDGTFIACKPDWFGYSYTSFSTGKSQHLSNDIALSDTGWTIYRPVPEDTNTISAYLHMVLHMLCARDVIPILLASALVCLLGLVSPAINRWVLDELVPQGQDAYGMLIMAAVMFLTAGFARVAVQASKTFS